jgi:hypothetical protein
MKHTLQSLLMATVLTLPTAFGSEPLSASTDPTTAAATTTATSSSIVTTSQRPQSTLDRFPFGVANQISGCAVKSSRDIITLGFLDLKDLYRLARVSTNWRKVAQPMLTALNTWRHSNVIPRLLEGFPLTFENHSILAFLGINTDASFDNVLKAAVAAKPWTMKMPMPDDEHTALVAFVDNDPTFTAPQKNILKSLLPNATPDDIRSAADVLSRLGSDYYDGPQRTKYHTTAGKLYELSANHQKATPLNIKLSADGLRNLGSKYYKRSDECTKYYTNAEKLYEQYALHPDARLYDIRLAARLLKDFSSSYPDGSDESTKCYASAQTIYKRLATQAGETLVDILSRASGFNDLGFFFPARSAKRVNDHDIAAALYELAAHHPHATPDDIRQAADGLCDLGYDYHDRANALLSRLPR